MRSPVLHARMQDELVALLAGRRGHFQMESGYHSDSWFALDPLFENRPRLQPFVAELARQLASHAIDAVCGPMTGGAKLAELIAAELNIEYFHTNRFETPEATGLFPVRYLLPDTQRENARGKTFAIVDDAISAGSAVRGTYADLIACGVRPVALGALFVFGDAIDGFVATEGLALHSVSRVSFGMWKPSGCPLCRSGLPVEKISDAQANPGPST